MVTDTQTQTAKIIVLATLSGGYAGADSVGQLHTSYPPTPTFCPCAVPACSRRISIYALLNAVFDAILVMFSGTDSPYKGSSERAAQIINKVYPLMKERGIDTRRLRLVAICTVCTQPFLKEVNQMSQLLNKSGRFGMSWQLKRSETQRLGDWKLLLSSNLHISKLPTEVKYGFKQSSGGFIGCWRRDCRDASGARSGRPGLPGSVGGKGSQHWGQDDCSEQSLPHPRLL
jgi:F420-non-reducing hydrogenase iron-sulfur subunit